MHARDKGTREKEGKKVNECGILEPSIGEKNTSVQWRTGQRWKRVVEECKGL